jgi:hypothetical protein
MTDARWASLRHQQQYTWFRDEQAEVTRELERARAAEAELREKLAHYEQYGHNLLAEKKRWEEGAAAPIKLEAHFRTEEAQLRAELAEWREAMPKCAHRDYPDDETKPIVPCTKTGTKHGNWPDGFTVYCDEHVGGPCDFACDQDFGGGRDLPWARLAREAENRKAGE